MVTRDTPIQAMAWRSNTWNKYQIKPSIKLHYHSSINATSICHLSLPITESNLTLTSYSIKANKPKWKWSHLLRNNQGFIHIWYSKPKPTSRLMYISTGSIADLYISVGVYKMLYAPCTFDLQIETIKSKARLRNIDQNPFLSNKCFSFKAHEGHSIASYRKALTQTQNTILFPSRPKSKLNDSAATLGLSWWPSFNHEIRKLILDSIKKVHPWFNPKPKT